jgi:hypothetical protein
MNIAKAQSGGAAAAGLAAKPIEALLSPATPTDHLCYELAQIFKVEPTEVALLQLQSGLLRFLFPDELKTSGTIPISSASTVAAQTATTRKTELFNNFLRVKHARIFESVRLEDAQSGEPREQLPIQKLISAPIIDDQRRVLGVIQICRKGPDVSTCGPDFTLEDLRRLELVAKNLASANFMQNAT